MSIPPGNIPSGTNPLDTLFELVRKKESQSDWLALLCRVTGNLILLLVTISGAVIGLLAKSNYTWKDDVILILGAIIVIAKTVTSTINLDQQALTYKQISIKLRDLSFTILTSTSAADPALQSKLASLYKEFDDLDQSLFSESLLGQMSPNGTPHTQTISYLRHQSAV